jgi:hypothetical protein
VYIIIILVIIIIIIINAYFFIQMSKMHDSEEPVLVAVRVRPLSSDENKKNAVSVVHLLPHEPKVSFIIVRCRLNIFSKTRLDTVLKQLYHISV